MAKNRKNCCDKSNNMTRRRESNGTPYDPNIDVHADESDAMVVLFCLVLIRVLHVNEHMNKPIFRKILQFSFRLVIAIVIQIVKHHVQDGVNRNWHRCSIPYPVIGFSARLHENTSTCCIYEIMKNYTISRSHQERAIINANPPK